MPSARTSLNAVTAGHADPAADMTTCALYLRTLGAAELVRTSTDGHTEPVLDASKLLAVVAYLALSPGRSATRDGLIDLLWADLEPDAARHALRQHLWQLKQRIGAELVVDGREQLTLHSPIASDRDEFLALADASELERAVALYRGEFFPGFAAAGSSEFERWADGERMRLRSTFVSCAELLAKKFLDTGRSRDAVTLCRRIRDQETLRQHGWRLLLEALVANHDLLNAGVEAESLERLLSDEEVEPEPATRSLIAAIRQARSAEPRPDATPALRVELVGREAEFASLLRAWERTKNGRLSVVHVTGSAGLGKSRLLAEFCSRLAAMRSRCVSIRANVGTTGIPYSLASQVAERLAPLPGARGISPDAMRVLVGLNPSLSSFFGSAPVSPPDADNLHHRVVALRELITALAEEKPLAILIDDLHWADSASCAVLSAVFGTVDERAPVLFCVTQRPGNECATFPASTERLALQPLTRTAVESLLLGIASLPATAWSDMFCAELMRSTGGIPLYVVESIQLALQEGLLAIADGAWRCEQPDELRALFAEGGVLKRRLNQLAPDELRILQTLAVAGTPLDHTLLGRVVPEMQTTFDTALASLAQKGLVWRTGSMLAVTHDEVTAVVKEISSSGVREQIHVALGRALAEEAGNDARRSLVAAGHFRAAGAEHELHMLFARFVRDLRRLGDRRTSLGLAADFLGTAPSAGETVGLVGSLPWTVRAGLVTRARIAAATSAFVLIPAGVAATFLLLRSPPRPPPDSVIAVAIENESGLSIYEARIDTAHGGPAGPLKVRVGGRPAWTYAGTGYRLREPRPGHPGSWVAERAVDDGGELELFLLSPERGVERLTATAGIDEKASWSPDGEHIVFSTGRWNELQHFDLAVLDLSSRNVRQLTAGDPSDEDAHWNPDGTRIAFRRKLWDRNAPQLCVIAVDGSGLRCESVAKAPLAPLHEIFDIGGWTDDSTLILKSAPSSAALLRLSDTWRLADTVALPGDVGRGWLSPNGRWISPSYEVFADTVRSRVVRTDAVAQYLPLLLVGARPPRASRQIGWTATVETRRFIDRLILRAGPGSPRVGIPYQLRTRAFDGYGRVTPLRSVSFASSDSSIASVDSLGVVSPLRAGSVTLSASAGGWRRTSISLTIVGNIVDTLLDEAWRTGISSAWVAFGEPLPAIDTGPGGIAALDNRGDGRFTSGVHSAWRYNVRNGLALDALVSTPVSLPQWQSQQVYFDFGYDSAGLAGWDHRTGEPSSAPGSQRHHHPCGFAYPSGAEGPSFGDSLRLFFGVENTDGLSMKPPRMLASGGWYRLRIQVFPDGRCGVALNGTPLGVSVPHDLPEFAHVFLQGLSYHTKILVGPITVRAGVPTDIDWSRPDISTELRPLNQPKSSRDR